MCLIVECYAATQLLAITKTTAALKQSHHCKVKQLYDLHDRSSVVLDF